MSEDLDLILREEGGNNPPGVINSINELIKQIFPEAGDAAKNFIRGKGAQEIAKTSDINASAIEKIMRASNENQRLVNERDAHIKEMKLQQERDNMEHKVRMRALDIEAEKVKLDKTKLIIEKAKVLKELGIDVCINPRELFDS